MRNYMFTYYGFIPSYGDFDQDWFLCEAENEEKAWELFNKTFKHLYAKSVYCEDITDKKQVYDGHRSQRREAV